MTFENWRVTIETRLSIKTHGLRTIGPRGFRAPLGKVCLRVVHSYLIVLGGPAYLPLLGSQVTSPIVDLPSINNLHLLDIHTGPQEWGGVDYVLEPVPY